jgi:thioredoxin 1
MHNRTGSDDLNELEELEAIRRKKLELLKHESSNKKGVEKMSSATEVKDSTFDDFVKANKIVIIDCWAPWCGPCRSLSPIIDELAKEFEGKIVFGKLNTDENENIPMRFNISAIPTLLVFKNGEMVDRIVGAGNKDFMRAKFAKHL